jgi:HEAT repeat protein
VKKFFWTFLLVHSLTSLRASSACAQELEAPENAFALECHLGADRIQQLEPIHVAICLKNISDKTLTLTSHALLSPRIFFAYENGQFEEYVEKSIIKIYKSHVPIPMSVQAEQRTSVIKTVGLALTPEEFLFRKPGVYKLKATVRLGSRTLESKTCVLVVEEFSDDANRKAGQLFASPDIVNFIRKQRQTPQVGELLEKLADDFPKSAFAAHANMALAIAVAEVRSMADKKTTLSAYARCEKATPVSHYLKFLKAITQAQLAIRLHALDAQEFQKVVDTDTLIARLGDVSDEAAIWGSKVLHGELVGALKRIKATREDNLDKLIELFAQSPLPISEAEAFVKGFTGNREEAAKKLRPDLWKANAMSRLLAAFILAKWNPDESENVDVIASYLKHDDAKLRLNAVRAISSLGAAAQKYVSHLTSFLNDGDADLRRAVMHGLMRMGKNAAPAADEIVKHLRNEDAEMRYLSADILSVLTTNPQAAVPALTQALRDQDKRVRQHAAIALSNYENAALLAIPALVESLKDDDADVRLGVSAALGQLTLNPRVTIPALINALEDSEEGVRYNAALGLERFGKEAVAALPALRARMEDKSEVVREAATSAVKKISGGK